MPRLYRVRFADKNLTACSIPSFKFEGPQAKGRHNSKSRLGCQECKRRRVKCDERYPVCLRCEQRNAVCHAVVRMAKWQVEMPSLAISSCGGALGCLSNTKKRLLQNWFEKVSQIMVIDPNENPMSYPVIQHLQSSSSLLHTILSISLAYETSFAPQDVAMTLNERHLALSLLQDELRSNEPPSMSSLLTVVMLGWSSSWIDQDKTQIGIEHFCGARVILDKLLEDATDIDSWLHFTAGMYIYWYTVLTGI
jgi:hypothetical protein